MSDFKIIGNPEPIVGKEEFYSVNSFLPSALPFQNTASATNSPFELPVKWEIYILENGRWRKTKENDKTGKRVSYTFQQKSLERKGIRMLVRRGDEVARLNIKTHPAEKPKIESIELLDKNAQKPAKPLSYGQTLKARVHCLHMEKHKVYVTLWEDDVNGGGHDKANEKNIIQTLPAIVKNGKADVDFLLRPSFAKIANKSKEEGKIHEYYVTTDFNKDKLASKNVDVNNLEAPVAPLKKKVPVQQPGKPKAAVPEPVKPKTTTPPSSAKAKAALTNVHITDAAGKAISGVYKEKQMKVWIDSVGLIGREINLKLYDKDYVSHDVLIDRKFKITGNIMAIDVFLDKIPRSLGGDIGEGAEQELIAVVEVLQTSLTKKSTTVEVDAKVFKQDPIEVTNKTAKVGEGDKNEGKSCGEKFCIKKGSPDSELIREVNIRLAGFGGNVPTNKFTDRTEKMIKQFQRDYMKVPETGKICGNVLKAIDEFQAKYPINFDEIKCKCGTCTGYGKGRNSEQYQSNSVLEPYRKYEYPGVHRSLICAYRASIFYINRDKELNYKTKWIDSGYRCHNHPIYVSTKTTNHCGKALDIHYNYLNSGKRARKVEEMEEIREKIFNKYLGAKWDWKAGQTDIFNLESTSKGAVSWVHVDVREFSQQYLKNEYFVKNISQLNGKSIMQLAKDLGFEKTCSCMASYKSDATKTKPEAENKRVDPKTLKASDKLIDFIIDWEKYRKDPYNDSKDYCTIGYGHLIKKKKCEDIVIPDEFKNGIDKKKAKELFTKDLKEFEKAVQRDVTVNLYQREFDALVDLLFNCGAYFLSTNKAPKLYKNLLEEKYEEAAKEFLDIENKKRRKQNYEIFINGNYDSTH
jgi:GH24 family phage-related lysozyme (muramidase)